MYTSFYLSDHNLCDLLRDEGHDFPADDNPEDDTDYVYEVDEEDELDAEGKSTTEKFTQCFKGKEGYIWSKKPKDRRRVCCFLKADISHFGISPAS